MIRRAPLAALGGVALAACALAQWSALGATLLLAAVAWWCAPRSRAAAVLAAALGARLLLPGPSWTAPPSPRGALATPLLRAIPEPDAAIAIGSLIGVPTPLPRDVVNAFRRSGTSHLLAVSGFNITLAASALAAILRPLGARAAAGATIAAAFTFAILAGLGPSVARAAVMASVAAVGVLLGRRGSGANALGAAVVVLLLADPRAVGDVGFLLSVSATLGLILFARPLERRLPGPAWLRAELAATLAATLASLPVSAEVFGRVAPISPLANLLAAPLVPPLMSATGIALVLCALAGPVGLPAAWAAYLAARALRAVVEVSAAVPFASVDLPHGGLAVLGVYGAIAAWTRWRSA